MNKPGFLGGLSRFLVAAALFFFLPTSSVLLFFSPAFIAHEYRQAGFPAADVYNDADRLRLGQETVRYLTGGNGVAEKLRALRHDGQPVYNEREVEHLVDVWVVLEGLRWVWRVAGLLLLGAAIMALRNPAWRRPLAGSLFQGSAALLTLLVTILVSALLSFDWFFVRFHQVFFASGTWTFEYTDSLIQFYPVDLWMDATWKLGATIVVGALAVGGLALTYLGRARS